MKKAKKEHFANLDVNSVTDSKIFWQIVKPLFQIKLPTIKLVENNEMIDDEIEIAKLFNEYFVNIFERLVILTKKTKHCFHKNRSSEREIAVAKYRNVPTQYKCNYREHGKLGNPTFDFDFPSYKETVKEVNNLKSRKVSQKAIFLLVY